MRSKAAFLRHLICVLLAAMAIGLSGCGSSGGGGSSSGTASGSAQ